MKKMFKKVQKEALWIFLIAVGVRLIFIISFPKIDEGKLMDSARYKRTAVHLVEGKGTQGFAPRVAERGGAERKRSRALIVSSLEHRDDIVAAKGPAKFLHDDTALLGHRLEGLSPADRAPDVAYALIGEIGEQNIFRHRLSLLSSLAGKVYYEPAIS